MDRKNQEKKDKAGYKKQAPVGKEQALRLQQAVDALVGVKGVRHAIAAVESLDGSFHWIGTAGSSQPEGPPMQADMPFWIASVTKLFIACSIMKLQEQGKLSIDHQIKEYLPKELLREILVYKKTDYSDFICIRHLLSHASGLPDYIIVHRKGEKTLFDRVLLEGDFSWTIEDVMSIVRDANKPLFPPQDLRQRKCRVQYSDTNFQLLIAIIEGVTGKTLHEAFTELLYEPLGLKQTFHPKTAPLEETKQEAAVWYKEKVLDAIPEALKSFNDLNSTVGDLLTFMKALLTGKVFHHPKTYEEMTSKWNRLGFAFTPVGPSWPMEYGLGMMRVRIPRVLTPVNPIPELIGHTGVCGSWLFYCPPLDVILTGTVSQVGAPELPFRFLPAFLRELAPILSEHKKAL